MPQNRSVSWSSNRYGVCAPSDGTRSTSVLTLYARRAVFFAALLALLESAPVAEILAERERERGRLLWFLTIADDDRARGKLREIADFVGLLGRDAPRD